MVLLMMMEAVSVNVEQRACRSEHAGARSPPAPSPTKSQRGVTRVVHSTASSCPCAFSRISSGSRKPPFSQPDRAIVPPIQPRIAPHGSSLAARPRFFSPQTRPRSFSLELRTLVDPSEHHHLALDCTPWPRTARAKLRFAAVAQILRTPTRLRATHNPSASELRPRHRPRTAPRHPNPNRNMRTRSRETTNRRRRHLLGFQAHPS